MKSTPLNLNLLNLYKFLSCAILALCMLPMQANAEVYKWKDKDGSVRYTDTPPPANIKQEDIVGGKKTPKPTGAAPLSSVANPSPVANLSADKTPKDKTITAEDAVVKLRQQNAETEKSNKKEKEVQAKLKEENCRAAKSNLASYQQGGRVYKTNEKGEREYLDDAGFKAGAQQAQKDIGANCNG